MKKFVFALMMTLMMGSIMNTAVAEEPIPTCFPCEESIVSGN
ncbi:MAG TPA: hypothetical protein VFB63_32490 [Bryobacteraceae bacterium]|nr:hypothetical protein [Bryobacteraceae bacterium]